MEIYAEGPEHAKILLIGESWGETEERERRPFVGRAGQILDGILDEVGLPRAMCRITNVMHERPANNNFSVYYEKGKPGAKLLEAYERLRNEIVSCQPNIIVPLGNEALKAVMGHGGILDWRGSVLTSPGPGVKVIPAIHPAAILRDWTLRPCTVADFNRIAKESEYGEVKTQERHATINPSLEEVLGFIETARRSEWISFDIETESNQITCIALAVEHNRAICIPFWFGSSGSTWNTASEELIWSKLKELLEGETPKKITQNGTYDSEFLLGTIGIRPKIHFDTMLGFHTLYAELPQSLAYLVSIYTDHPFYKAMRKTDKMDTLWRYNSLDAMLTYECAMKIIEELREANQLDFYYTYVHALMEPLFAMTERGVKFDTEKKRDVKTRLTEEVCVLQTKLNTLVGHELNINSYKQMTEWLYNELKLTSTFKKRQDGSKTLAADEEALNEHYRKTKNEAIKIVLEMRERGKLLSTYLDIKLDADKRIRCTYNIAGTETGRLSSSATAFNTGTNLQNIPDGIIRSLFVADDGYIFINADLSQAEARVVAFLANDQRLLDVFTQNGDIHKKNASRMFGIPEDQVSDDQRYLAKRAVHGLNYGMGYITFAKECGIDLATAKRVYNSYFATFPRVRLWHMNTKGMLQKARVLTTPFGRKRIFFNNWNDQLLKEGLAFVPQSTVADIVNQAIVKLHKAGPGDGSREMLLQVHDSILVQVKPEHVHQTVVEMREAMTHPLEINGKIMTIPVDFKIGRNWAEMEKYNHAKTY